VEEPLQTVVPRRLFEIIEERIHHEPVLALQGPRTVGKSTLLRELATVHGGDLVDLDDLATRDAVAADPAFFAGGREPVCFDEYQKVPAVLDAIKAELNRDTRPGRFVITGSTRSDALPEAAQALTGRLHLLTVYPLSQGEIARVREDLIERVFTEPLAAVAAAGESDTTREAYIARITAGGFPLAIRRSGSARNRWFDDYIRLTLERDVRELAKIRQRSALPRLLEKLAAQTGQVLNIHAAAAATGMLWDTADNYLKLLEAVFLLYRLPAWGSTLRARAAALPKLHVIDSGVASRLLRLTPEKLARRDATSLTQFGHLLETFVVGEVIKQTTWLDGIGGYGHWRTYDGDEVDLVVEREDGALIAIEVKAGGRVPGTDLSGLRKLRDATGDAFIAGIAFYLGRRSYTYEDRISVMPVDRLWTAVSPPQ
jgi:hypothetical protein